MQIFRHLYITKPWLQIKYGKDKFKINMWTPREIRKLLVLLTGVGLEVAGVVLIIKQVDTTGIIDISSSLISGKIQSGSAGLLICFIGLFVIALSIFGGKETIIRPSNIQPIGDQTEITVTTLKADEKRALLSILLGGLLTLGLILGGIYLEDRGWKGAGIISFFGFFCAMGEGILIIAFLSSYLDIESNKEKKNKTTSDKT